MAFVTTISQTVTTTSKEMKYKKIIFTINCHNDSKENSVRQTTKDLLCAMTAEAGLEAFEDTPEGINGYAQMQLLDTRRLSEIMSSLPLEGVDVTFKTTDAEDKNWNETWERTGFDPIIVNDRCIIHDTMHTVAATPEMTDVIINAEQAFGTGTHETTQMIVSRLLDMDIKGHTLDCGCGTGILSIVASKLGAENVTAYDVDEWSVRNTKSNCALNGVTNVTAVCGDVSVVEAGNKFYDLALANINRNILMTDMPAISRHLAEGGLMIISGFYTSDATMLTDRASSLNLIPDGRMEKNNWCMLAFKKTARS